MIVTYRHRPKPKRAKAQAAKIMGSAIIHARQPKKYMRGAQIPVDAEADERLRAFFSRMGWP